MLPYDLADIVLPKVLVENTIVDLKKRFKTISRQSLDIFLSIGKLGGKLEKRNFWGMVTK